MLEKGGDASDVQTEAPRSASRSVNAAGEERLVLLPPGRAPGAARQRCNPQTQGRAHGQAPGKHGPQRLWLLIPPRIVQHCAQAAPGETKETSIMRRGGVTGAHAPLRLEELAVSDRHGERRSR